MNEAQLVKLTRDTVLKISDEVKSVPLKFNKRKVLITNIKDALSGLIAYSEDGTGWKSYPRDEIIILLNSLFDIETTDKLYNLISKLNGLHEEIDNL